jgi:hypothetical protein
MASDLAMGIFIDVLWLRFIEDNNTAKKLLEEVQMWFFSMVPYSLNFDAEHV